MTDRNLPPIQPFGIHDQMGRDMVGEVYLAAHSLRDLVEALKEQRAWFSEDNGRYYLEYVDEEDFNNSGPQPQ